jgi:hypothetical protein
MREHCPIIPFRPQPHLSPFTWISPSDNVCTVVARCSNEDITVGIMAFYTLLSELRYFMTAEVKIRPTFELGMIAVDYICLTIISKMDLKKSYFTHTLKVVSTWRYFYV